jgi:ATP-dependent Lon protease
VKDLKEIPDNIKQDLNIKPVRWIDEVLSSALSGYPARFSRKNRKNKKSKSTLVGTVGKNKIRKSDRIRTH